MRVWEIDDLTIPKGYEREGCGGGHEEESKKRVFRNPYNTWMPSYYPTTAQTYLAIHSEWFTRYVGDELDK